MYNPHGEWRPRSAASPGLYNLTTSSVMPQNSEQSEQWRRASEAKERLRRRQHFYALGFIGDQHIEKLPVVRVSLRRFELRVRPVAAPQQAIQAVSIAQQRIGLFRKTLARRAVAVRRGDLDPDLPRR